eukprot:m.217165 g.217165  ORF g.217165 m.217165 type:complete len:326 (-) comp15598_c0_seq1:74-1051(-)
MAGQQCGNRLWQTIWMSRCWKPTEPPAARVSGSSIAAPLARASECHLLLFSCLTTQIDSGRPRDQPRVSRGHGPERERVDGACSGVSAAAGRPARTGLAAGPDLCRATRAACTPARPACSARRVSAGCGGRCRGGSGAAGPRPHARPGPRLTRRVRAVPRCGPVPGPCRCRALGRRRQPAAGRCAGAAATGRAGRDRDALGPAAGRTTAAPSAVRGRRAAAAAAPRGRGARACGCVRAAGRLPAPPRSVCCGERHGAAAVPRGGAGSQRDAAAGAGLAHRHVRRNVPPSLSPKGMSRQDHHSLTPSLPCSHFACFWSCIYFLQGF